MFSGQNIWVFKPNDLNRGWGVTLFNSIDQLKKLVQDFTQGIEIDSEEGDAKVGKLRSNVFVI